MQITRDPGENLSVGHVHPVKDKPFNAQLFTDRIVSEKQIKMTLQRSEREGVGKLLVKGHDVSAT